MGWVYVGYQAAADEFNFDDGFDINDIDQLAPRLSMAHQQFMRWLAKTKILTNKSLNGLQLIQWKDIREH